MRVAGDTAVSKQGRPCPDAKGGQEDREDYRGLVCAVLS